MIDTASLNANELVSKLKSGDISSVDLCKAYLKRIEKFTKYVGLDCWIIQDTQIISFNGWLGSVISFSLLIQMDGGQFTVQF